LSYRYLAGKLHIASILCTSCPLSSGLGTFFAENFLIWALGLL